MTVRQCHPRRFTHLARLAWLGTVLIAAPLPASAFDLGVYGHGGYDLISSKPPEGAPATVASPEPSGPSYGLGLTSELVRFADGMVGLGASLGFGGMSASWKADKAGVTPSAVSLSAMGVELGGKLLIHFSSFRIFGYGDFLYGVVGNEYTNTQDGTSTDPNGKVTTFKVDSALRFSGGAGAGYAIGNFAIDLRGGLASVSMNVTTPSDAKSDPNKAVTDTYVGFTFGAVASYRFLGGEAAAEPKKSDTRDRVKPSSEGKNSSADKKQPKKRKKRKKPDPSP